MKMIYPKKIKRIHLEYTRKVLLAIEHTCGVEELKDIEKFLYFGSKDLKGYQILLKLIDKNVDLLKVHPNTIIEIIFANRAIFIETIHKPYVDEE
jgi:mannose-6-phosphate isomerase class I